jgi:hypothetical protein
VLPPLDLLFKALAVVCEGRRFIGGNFLDHAKAENKRYGQDPPSPILICLSHYHSANSTLFTRQIELLVRAWMEKDETGM